MLSFAQRSCFPTFGLILTAGVLPAQSLVLHDAQEAELRALDPGTSDYFGHDVAIDNGVAVVGSTLDDNGNGGDAGAVYVFEKSGSSWVQTAKLVASDGATSDYFGYSADISGNTIVVGAYGDNTAAGADAGSAYVFVRCNGNWIEQARLYHPSGATSDRFGIDVAVDAGTIIIGCYLDDTCATDAGSAWAFVRDDAGTPSDPCDDTWLSQGQLTPSICNGFAEYGRAVSVQGNRAVVGAHLENSPAVDQGAAYVFERSGSTWTESARLLAGDGAADDRFGYGLSLDGNRILVGAYYDDAPATNSGSAYLFELQGGFWLLQQKLVGSNSSTGNVFGFALKLQGESALIGAYGYASNTGAAYLFRKNGATWVEDQIVTTFDGAGSDEGALALDLDDGIAILGVRRDDDTASDSGSAALFAISQGQFERYGFGDGSGTACPCTNSSSPFKEQGCINSRGFGGKLSAAGSDSAAADDLRLVAGNLIPGNPALLFSGPTRLNAGAGIVFGNGLRVAGGFLTRYNPPKAPNGDGIATWGPNLGSSHGGWPIGSAVHFQVWYRDPFHGSCVDVFNLSNGLSVLFRP